jgi:general stress protein CsbA
MYSNFWIYITRIVILVLASISGEINDNFWIRFMLIFAAFMLFDVHDAFSAKKKKQEQKREKAIDEA